MRYLAFIGFILLLAAVESTVPQVLHLELARPLLLVPLVLYFALKLNTIEGALLTAAAGFAVDATAGYPSGLATFALMAIFVGSRLILVGFGAEGRLFEALFTAGLAGAYHGVTWAVSRLLGPEMTSAGEGPWASTVVWTALATALATPLVMAGARRIDRIDARSAESL